MPAPRLSTLSAELVTQIMSSLQRPGDLSALIRTSMRNYHVFMENETTILQAIVRNAFPSIILNDAIAACEASQVARLWWGEVRDFYTPPPEDRRSPFLTAQAAFIEQYPQRYQQRLLPLSDRKLLRSLYKLSYITDELVIDFGREALFQLSQQMSGIRPMSGNSLSLEEDARLRRAFFRFETYRKLFPNVIGIEQRFDPKLEIKQQFFQLFPPWAREELLSVQEYLTGRTKNLFQYLQQYIVQTISTLSQESSQGSEKPTEIASLSEIKAYLDLGGHDIFQHSLYYNTYRRLQHLVAMGLPFLRFLLHLPPNDQISIIQSYSIIPAAPSLFESLYDCRHYLQSLETSLSCRQEVHSHLLARPNEGWSWAEAQRLTAGADDILQRYALRKMGYVFWSNARLNDEWALHTMEASRFELNIRSMDDNESLEDYGPTIEERFHDIVVLKEVIRNVDSGASFNVSKKMKRVKDDSVEDDDEFPMPFDQYEIELYGIEY